MDFDILIVGGGMVGATLACALGDTALRIGVIESAEAPMAWSEDEFDIRVSAITRATERVFAGIGAWQGMEQRRVQAYSRMPPWRCVLPKRIAWWCQCRSTTVSAWCWQTCSVFQSAAAW